MTNRETMELFIEKNGQETVAYPFVEKDHVVFGNGMGIEEVIEQDVSMPTVTHEEVSFKVGVGDQDVSSSVVDSSVGEMVIKGKTYHNILPEPSTHVLTNSKEMFKVDEGLDSIVEVVDGVAKSAILKGQTLVNVFSNATPNFQTNATTTGNKTINLTSDGAVCHSWWNVDLQTTKQYMLSINITTNTSTGNLIVKTKDEKLLKKFDVGITGKQIIVFTPTDSGIRFKCESPSNRGTTIIDDIILIEYQEGMENWDIPYFEGMKSVKMPVLTTTGKNLFDGELLQGVLDDNTGEFSKSNNGLSSKNYLNVSENTIYTISKNIEVDVETKIFFYDDGKRFIKYQIATNSFTTPSNCKFIKIRYYKPNIVLSNHIFTQLEQGSSATSYEPFKSNILSSSEEVVLRGIGDVRDELDCLTGEVTERIGEIVLDGSEDWLWTYDASDTRYAIYRITLSDVDTTIQNNVLNCLSEQVKTDSWGNINVTFTDKTFGLLSNKQLRVQFNGTLNELKDWLSITKPIIQYKKEKSVKTVDLSTSGNWEKVVFDGSEGWSKFNIADLTTTSQFYLQLPNFKSGVIICNEFPYYSSRITQNGVEGVSGSGGNGLNIWLNILNSKIGGNTVEKFKQYLSQNPLTVWYQTTTHQDSTQVKQPIFFKDGHIIQSSGTDNSLIPTLDYQAKTSNSYVMDLMKTNTRYTMKAKSASGTFTIDGTSYGAGTNGTFTTPSSMTNKFLVMSNNANEEVMILEGDVVSKTIPYFKGIKSAFEDESKIEVLSTGKNLFDGEMQLGAATSFSTGKHFNECFASGNLRCYSQPFEVGSAERVSIVLTNPNHKYAIYQWDNNKGYIVGTTWLNQSTSLALRDNTTYISIYMANADDSIVNPLLFKDSLQVEVANSPTTYEPYKSNSTKIPLLSPLRSLPNGVCDELIIDRMKKKATLIQRVGDIFVNGSEKWNNMEITTPTNYVLLADNRIKCGKDRHFNNVSSSFPVQSSYDRSKENCYVAHKNQLIFTPFTERFRNLQEFKQWLSQNPTTVYYQLETPVITEVDLEGFPYIYKDGHIFLNSEIAPTTQIIYSISQQHQIDASTQDLIRHEQEIDYLYKLIAQYIQVDYQSTLLSLDLKLK